MKLKKLIKNTYNHQVVVIINRNEEIIVEGRLDTVGIIIDALGNEQILSTYSDMNFLTEDYTTIVLDTEKNKKDIFRGIYDYLNTLSSDDIVTIIGGERLYKLIKDL